jgi:AraC-like DNA-binding protein
MSQRVSAFYTVEPRDLSLPLYATSIGLNQEQRTISRESGYDGFHFFRCIQGVGEVQAGSRHFALRENMSMILYPQEPHRYEPVGGPWLVDWITFGGSSAASVLSYLEIGHSAAFDLPHPQRTASVIRHLEELLRDQQSPQKLDVSCRIYELLASLFGNEPSSKTRPRETRYQKLEPVLRYIEQHYGEPLTLELLAQQAGVSPRHLCLLFREALHMRPFRHINTLRINHCKRLLLERRDMTIAQAAALCGFENICYFNQTFRTIAGMSPTQFRDLH